MKIAIVGPGGIGSTFAVQLARAGNKVTVIARGKRLEQLQRDHAIVSAAGDRAEVQVSAALDTSAAWDLVLVTVLAHQVDAVLPALAASAARAVMFTFNTFESLDRLRIAVGSARFAFGFPAILATLDDGKLTSKIVTRGMVTTVTDAAWAKVFPAGCGCGVKAAPLMRG
ncbi:2-dehydropantoate 2-reductase N-terminal domain-containing protein [Sorangium sp. So ce302]|uniref:ketopantoate reductase family protein n=1 Tax=Sorangium sp. So ce302 TaxID=3133297 RepID=UPI003F5F9AC4